MHSLIELKYKILSSKSREVLQFFRDYLLDDHEKKYRHLTEKNVGIEEKSVLYRKDLNAVIPNLTLNKYINNGYLLNTGDRVICLPYSLDTGLVDGYFLYTPDTNKAESTRPINIFFINSNIKDISSDEVLYNKYILATSNYILNTIISHMIHFPELYNIPFNLFETRLDNTISISKVQNFIASMMVLDDHYNLKFADWNAISSSCKYEDGAEELMKRVYYYAIEENKTDKEYEEILEEFYHM